MYVTFVGYLESIQGTFLHSIFLEHSPGNIRILDISRNIPQGIYHGNVPRIFHEHISARWVCTFLLAKENTWKRIFNTNSELSQNRTEKQIMPFKTTLNWLFNDIWCYLVIGSFDWKIGIFQQAVVKGLLYP